MQTISNAWRTDDLQTSRGHLLREKLLLAIYADHFKRGEQMTTNALSIYLQKSGFGAVSPDCGQSLLEEAQFPLLW